MIKVIKVEKTSQLEKRLNELAEDGWRPILISQVSGARRGYTVVLEK